jgi:UDP-N-acetylglucosamine 2-epimerase
MKKLKILTVVGTRPEIIRLSCIIRRLDNTDSICHVLVHTGQNYDYELNEIFFKDLELRKPDYYLKAAGKNASETIGQSIIAIDKVLEEEKPDAVLILGDTNSSMCAIPAKKRHIPIFHMEAGNRCFDQRVPEETNRKIVDHLADVNLTYSAIAREYLISEGLPPDRIIKTGSPMFEVLDYYMKKIKGSKITSKLGLSPGEFFIISCHREENIGSERNFMGFFNMVNGLADTYQLPIIISTHPRTQKMINQKKVKFHQVVRLIKPLGFSDYVALELNSKAVLSDSGTISEEASILNLKALNIRETHERPEAMEEATVIMTGFNFERVLQGLSVLESQQLNERRVILVEEYTKPNVSEKIVRIIISYTDYIKRVVWAE